MSDTVMKPHHTISKILVLISKRSWKSWGVQEGDVGGESSECCKPSLIRYSDRSSEDCENPFFFLSSAVSLIKANIAQTLPHLHLGICLCLHNPWPFLRLDSLVTLLSFLQIQSWQSRRAPFAVVRDGHHLLLRKRVLPWYACTSLAGHKCFVRVFHCATQRTFSQQNVSRNMGGKC